MTEFELIVFAKKETGIIKIQGGFELFYGKKTNRYFIKEYNRIIFINKSAHLTAKKWNELVN